MHRPHLRTPWSYKHGVHTYNMPRHTYVVLVATRAMNALRGIESLAHCSLPCLASFCLQNLEQLPFPDDARHDHVRSSMEVFAHQPPARTPSGLCLTDGAQSRSCPGRWKRAVRYLVFFLAAFCGFSVLSFFFCCFSHFIYLFLALLPACCP